MGQAGDQFSTLVEVKRSFELLQSQKSVLELRGAAFDIAAFHRLDGAVQVARQNVIEHYDQFDGAGVAYRRLLIGELCPIGAHWLEFDLVWLRVQPFFELEFEFDVNPSSELICCCSSGNWRKARSTCVYCAVNNCC